MKQMQTTNQNTSSIVQWAMQLTDKLQRNESAQREQKKEAPETRPASQIGEQGNARSKGTGNARPFITVYNDILVVSTKAI